MSTNAIGSSENASLKKNSIEIDDYEENYEEGYLSTVNKELSLTDINQIEDTLPITPTSIQNLTPTATVVATTTTTFILETKLPANPSLLDIVANNVTAHSSPLLKTKKHTLMLSKKSKSISNNNPPEECNLTEKKANSNVELNKADIMVKITSEPKTSKIATLNDASFHSHNSLSVTANAFQSNNTNSVTKRQQVVKSLTTSPKKTKKASTDKMVMKL